MCIRDRRDVLAEGGDWIEVAGVRKHVAGYLKDFLFDPNLIDAKVGTLSGGERSRLLLAREFARPSNLLVLDEPNSNLDTMGERALTDALNAVRERGGIVIVIAHRPSALAAVNKTLMIQNGTQVAFGDRDEVLRKVVPANQGVAKHRGQLNAV